MRNTFTSDLGDFCNSASEGSNYDPHDSSEPYDTDRVCSYEDGFGTLAGAFQVPSEADSCFPSSDIVTSTYGDNDCSVSHDTFSDSWDSWGS